MLRGLLFTGKEQLGWAEELWEVQEKLRACSAEPGKVWECPKLGWGSEHPGTGEGIPAHGKDGF